MLKRKARKKYFMKISKVIYFNFKSIFNRMISISIACTLFVLLVNTNLIAEDNKQKDIENLDEIIKSLMTENLTEGKTLDEKQQTKLIKAMELNISLIKANPSDYELNYKLCLLYYITYNNVDKKYEGLMLEQLRNTILIDSKNPKAYRLQGDFYLILNKGMDAVNSYCYSIYFDKENKITDNYLKIGIAYYYSGAQGFSVSFLDAYLKIHKDDEISLQMYNIVSKNYKPAIAMKIEKAKIIMDITPLNCAIKYPVYFYPKEVSIGLESMSLNFRIPVITQADKVIEKPLITIMVSENKKNLSAENIIQTLVPQKWDFNFTEYYDGFRLKTGFVRKHYEMKLKDTLFYGDYIVYLKDNRFYLFMFNCPSDFYKEYSSLFYNFVNDFELK